MSDEEIAAELTKVFGAQGYGLTEGDAIQALAALRADGFDITTPAA